MPPGCPCGETGRGRGGSALRTICSGGLEVLGGPGGLPGGALEGTGCGGDGWSWAMVWEERQGEAGSPCRLFPSALTSSLYNSTCSLSLPTSPLISLWGWGRGWQGIQVHPLLQVRVFSVERGGPCSLTG